MILHNYRVKFYFASWSQIVDVVMHDRKETLTEICSYLVKTEYQYFIDRNGAPTVVVHMPNVTKIEIEEVSV